MRVYMVRFNALVDLLRASYDCFFILNSFGMLCVGSRKKFALISVEFMYFIPKGQLIESLIRELYKRVTDDNGDMIIWKYKYLDY